MKIKVLQDEVIRLTDLLQKNEEYTKKLTGHVCQESDLQKRVQEHLALFVVLFAEIESLRQRLIYKEEEVETVRRSSLAPFMSR